MTPVQSPPTMYAPAAHPLALEKQQQPIPRRSILTADAGLGGLAVVRGGVTIWLSLTSGKQSSDVHIRRVSVSSSPTLSRPDSTSAPVPVVLSQPHLRGIGLSGTVARSPEQGKRRISGSLESLHVWEH